MSNLSPRTRTRLAALLLGTSLLALGSPALAVTTTFNGGFSSNWSDGANWIPTPPAANDSLVLGQNGANAPSNYDINGTFHSLTLNTAGNATTLANGYTVNAASGFTLGLQAGGFINDIAANAAVDHLNMAIALNNSASIQLASGATGLVIGGNISGTGGLNIGNFNGTGLTHLIVLGGANTYTGGTHLTNGTLAVSSDANLGNTSGAISIDSGAQLYMTSGFTTNRAVFLTGGTGIINTALVANPTYIFNGVISGAGGLNKTGGGVMVLTANNTYLGSTTISAGALSFGDLAGGTTGMVNGNIVDNGTLEFHRTDNITYGNSISGTGNVVKYEANTLVLTGNHSYSGGTVVQDGTLQLGNGGAGGMIVGDVFLTQATASLDFNHSNNLTYAGAISGAGTLVKSGTNTVVLTGANVISGLTTISGGTLQIGNGGTQTSLLGDVLNSGVLAIDLDSPALQFLTGNISGVGSLQQNGTGTTILTGTNTYSGGTTINAGVLQIGNGDKFGTIAGDIVDNATLVIALNNDDVLHIPTVLSLSGVISGSGQLVQNGQGTTILLGDNTYGGGTTISAGTLQVGNGGTAGALPFLGDVVDNAALVFNRSDAIGMAGDISGTGSVTQLGAGALDLQGNNTFSGGLNIQNGTVFTDMQANVGNGPVNITNNAILANSGGTFTANVNLNAGGGTLSNANTTTWTGTLAGGGMLTKAGTGRLILGANNTYTGNTTVSAGVLQIGNGGVTGTILGNVVDNATLDFDRFDNITFAGVISGSGVVEQIGDGILTLSGANTYSGGTNILSGTIRVANDGNLGTGGIVDMAQGTTLAITASGTFAHAVKVTGDPTFSIAPSTTTVWSGQIADGSGPGTVEVAGGGTFNPTNAANSYSGGTIVKGGSTIRINLDHALGDAGGGLQLGDALTKGTINVTQDLALAATRAVVLGAGGGIVSTEPTVTFEMSQPISGSGGLTVSNSGKLVLSGVSTYSGGTTITGGNLQLGNGTSTGLVAGNIANNGTLTFNEGADATFAGAISGSGTLTQNDATGHTVTLTGANTYTGITTLVQGGLSVGNGGTSGAIAGDVVDNTTLTFNRSDALAYGGTVGGSGALVKTGAGTLILTGNSSYAGQTTIAAGTLQLGNGGTVGTVAGSAVVDNGILAFNRSNTLTFATLISGTGSVQQLGLGATVLTQDETYTGGTLISAGTLQLGNGGTAGSVVGDIADNAALAFNRSNTLTYGGMISGAGTVTQAGTGTTVLTGASTYSGGTTITAGTLQVGNGGTTGSIAGNVTDNAALVFNRSDSVTFGGTIAGSGTLTQAGTGTLVLTGADAVGGTTIAAGTLQLGNGGTTGSLSGAIADNGILAFNRTDAALVVAGPITGSGSVRQIGSGTTTLSGTNTYTGGTTITGGTLRIGNGGATGSIAGNVVDNGTLAFNRADAMTFAGVISGTGSVVQMGVGTTTLGGASTYSGPTSVNSGTLLVNGSIAASATTVNSTGTLGGTGTVGALSVGSGGTVAPGGGGVGTLTVNGALTLGAGSNYIFDSTAAQSDLLTVNGTAALNGTLTLNPTGSGFDYMQNIVVVNATGGRTGTFSAVTLAGSFGGNLVPVIGYDANHAFVTFVPAAIAPLLPTGATVNQTGVAGAIDFAILHDNAAIAFGPLGQFTPAQLGGVLDQMSGEGGLAIHTFGTEAMGAFLGDMLDPSVGGRGGVGDGGLNLAANAPVTRLAYNGPAGRTPIEQRSGLTAWGAFHGARNSSNADPLLGTHSSSATTLGGTLGLNYSPRNNGGAVGLVLGIDQLDWKLASVLGKGHAQAAQAGVYYSRKFGANYFAAAFSYAHYNVTTDRTLIFGGTNTYHAKFDASDIAGRFEFGRVFHTGEDTLTPYVLFQAQDFGTPDYAETTTAGSPLFALAYTARHRFDYLSELGSAWNTVLQQSNDSVTALQARLGWQHNYAERLFDTATFTGFAGASFTVYGAPPPRDAGHLKLGVEHDFDNITLTLNADSTLSGTAQNYGGTASMSFRW